MGAFKSIWQPVDSGEPIIEAFGGLDLDYINERYRIYDPALGRLVEKPWADIVNNRSLPAGRTYWDADGVLQTAAADAPVIEYDPVTGVKLGNRILGSYGNLSPNSDFVGAAVGPGLPPGWDWESQRGLSAEILAVGAERGLPHVDLRIFGETTSSGIVEIRRGFGSHFSAGQTATGSAYLRWLSDTGAVSSPGVGLTLIRTSDFSRQNTGITLGGEFKRTVTSIGVPSSASVQVRIRLDAWTAGSNVDIVLRISGQQLEASSSPGPLVRTTGSAVTIPAESQIIDGQNFLDLWNPGSGTVIAFASSRNALGYLFQSDNGTGLHRRLMRFDGGGGVRAFSIQNSAIGSNSTGSAYAENALKKAATTHNRGGTNLVAADGTTTGFGDATPEEPIRLRIGSDGSSASTINGHFRRLIVLRKALPASLLQRITQL